MAVDVLIFSAGYGGGHQAAARALQEGLALVQPQWRVEIVDFLATINPRLDQLARLSYSQMVRRAPLVWRGFYLATGKVPEGSLLQRRLNHLGLSRTMDLLLEYGPRVVVSTYPLPAGAVAELKRRGMIALPLVTAVTDQAVHPQWLHQGTDLYLVGSPEAAAGLAARSVAGRVAVTGIPIAPAFARPLPRDEARALLDLDPGLPVVLVMGGADGMLKDMGEICHLLGRFALPLQLVVVAGRDSRGRRAAAMALRECLWPVRVLGFTSQVPQLMAAADVLIGKAGGLTTAEAAACRLPMVLYRPIPGQEEENCRFLVQAGAAIRVKDLDAMGTCLEEMLARPGMLAAMQAAAAKLGYPEAALTAARRIVDLVEDQGQREWREKVNNLPRFNIQPILA